MTPRRSPWAAIDALPQKIVQQCGIVGIAELALEGADPFVRVFCSNVPGAVASLPGSMNGFPVEVSECGKSVPPDQLEGLRQIRHYNVMAEMPAPTSSSATPAAGGANQRVGQATDLAQTVTQPITDAITGGYDMAKGAYDSITGTASSLSAATAVTDAMQSAYQSQQQAAQNALALQRALAAQSASSAGQQASGAASNLGAIVILAAVGLAAVIWLSRK